MQVTCFAENFIMHRNLLALFILFSISVGGYAQSGSISGHIADGSNSEDLMGANVSLESDPGKGAATDLDGRYFIDNIAPGTYNVVVSYIGYQSKVIEKVEVKSGVTTALDASLSNNANELQEVVVRTELSKENINSLMIMQKNSTFVSDGISADVIRRTSDKNTAEAIKRVSGISLADNKFVIVRGLSDRYNSAMINGTPLPSTEADKKNFTFDLIPSSLVDNIVVIKTAQPDLPGDFAGGIIQVNTRDIPDKNSLTISLSSGFNSISTFKSNYSYPGGKLDWLGLDDGTRALPENFPTTETLQNASEEETVNSSKLLSNDWAYDKGNSTRPNFNGQVSGGWKKTLSGSDLGGIFSLTYSNSQRFHLITRQDYNLTDTSALYRYKDSTYINNVLAGALFNVGLKISRNSKIVFKNSYTINTSDHTIVRGGTNYEQQFYVRNFAYNFIENKMLNSQLVGDHYLNGSNIKLHWEGSYARITRSEPDYRKLYYNRNIDDTSGTFLAYVPFGSASPSLAGKFYSALTENIYSGAVDGSYNFNFLKQKSILKTGFFYQQRGREFDARVLGYTITNPSQFFSENPDPNAILGSQPADLFAPEHIGTAGFSIDDITNPSDHYSGSSDLVAPFIMLDNQLPAHFRLVWGARFEFFHQTLQSFDYTNNPIEVDTRSSDFNKVPFDFLPSVNLIYSLDKKTNFRLSASKTVVRPEFRELAPFSFYDFATTSVVIGNDSLKRTNIFNYDFRVERFLGGGQMISASLFYKKFNQPIEQNIDFISSGGYIRSYANVTSAENFGAEIEFRKNFDFLQSLWKQFSNFAISTNLAYISSVVNIAQFAGVDSSRSLQGQSPYIINIGLNYEEPKSGFTFSAYFNEIGRRISAVGSNVYLDIYEAPRPILDVQFSKRVLENGTIRLNFQDVLANSAVLYQDYNNDKKFVAGEDKEITRTTYGRVISLGFNYRF